MVCRTAATSTVVAIAVLLGVACGGRTVVVTPRSAPAAQLAELWIDPGPRPRDLFWGVGGQRYAPAPKTQYSLVGKDEAGFSVSYDVTDPEGLEWSAKIGDEAQTEVVVSRLLWGVGYHQPPIYYLPSWQLAARPGDDANQISEARFRPKLPQLDRTEEWSWADNPFSGTRQMKGLLVILLMLNSTDLKDTNNVTYQMTGRWDGASRWFVVRDLGASLGETGKLYPRRNWQQAFEDAPFIVGIDGDRIELEYDGRHQELLSMLTPADVQWGSRLLARLTETQWRDAFRAANYSDADAGRFIGRIKEKIADGIALRIDRRATAAGAQARRSHQPQAAR